MNIRSVDGSNVDASTQGSVAVSVLEQYFSLLCYFYARVTGTGASYSESCVGKCCARFCTTRIPTTFP